MEFNLSPHRIFDRNSWAALRQDQALELTKAELEGLRALGDPISLDEVVAIYLPIIRLLELYISAHGELREASRAFLGTRLEPQDARGPFIIGVAGSVAVGKSTTARLLHTLLGRHRKVDLITTDGFLKPNAQLDEEGLITRKGFPESYDRVSLLRFLNNVKRGVPAVAPVYSHESYDVQEGEGTRVEGPDVLILEGLNVLQPAPMGGVGLPAVSDFFNFSVYIDADPSQIEHWYRARFMRLRETAFQDPAAFFHRYTKLSVADAQAKARALWKDINLVNLRENIEPTRGRAQLILRKVEDHRVDQVSLRRV